MLSIVIPTLNAADTLASCLESISARRFVREVIVVDGGSDDLSGSIAAAHGCVLRTAPRGRGRQLAAGALWATGEWLLFLHADTRLEGDWAAALERHMTDPRMGERVGVFGLRFATDDPRARRVAALANWRTRVLALPYGDQGLLIRRDFYHRIGGFSTLPIMEDIDLIGRVSKARLVMLDGEAVTSPRRYQNGGWLMRPLRNLGCLSLYFLGVPPKWIARLY